MLMMTDIGGGDGIDKNRWSGIMILMGGLYLFPKCQSYHYLIFKSYLIQNFYTIESLYSHNPETKLVL